jgi:AraC-like DNA-binding protein
MDDLEFDSCDLAATEDFLVRAYTRIRIGSDGQDSRVRIMRRWMGEVNVDDLTFSYDMNYAANPLGRICLCRVHSGHIEENVIGEPQNVFAPGDLSLLAPPNLPYAGRVCRAKYDLTMFDPSQLDRVAATAPGARNASVRLTGQRPVSAAAGRQLSAAIDYFRLLTRTDTKPSALIAATAASHLAASVLSAFPNNALTDPTAADRNAATPTLLRRAMSYIEDQAHTDIAIGDVAAHVYATPRAVQYVFRRHLDMTPMQYLRLVRLTRAHRDLVLADPDVTTVSAVAARWGFAHHGRFASLYRQTYGKSPHQTLNT